MVESCAHLLKSRTTATVYELLPAPDQLCVTNREGTFAHELIVMLAKPPAEIATALVNPVTTTGVEDEFGVVPFPNWPLLPAPQHFAVPFATNAHEK